jgi:hypothetical protein
MKTTITFLSLLLIATHSFGQNIPSFLPKWYEVDKDTTLKDKKLTYSGFPVCYKQDKESNIYELSFTIFGYQLSKIEANTGKKVWTTSRNQSFGTENKVYYPKDFFFRPDGNIVLLSTKGAKFPAFTTFGSTIKCVYDTKTGKEIFTFINEKKGGSAITFNAGSLEKQIVEKPNQKGYYFADGIAVPKIMSWIRTVDSNFVANDTLYIKQPSLDTAKEMSLISLSPFHQIRGKFYQMSAYFGSTDDTSLVRTYFTKINYENKKYTVKDVSKYLFHGLDNISFSPVKDGFIVSAQADSTYGAFKGLPYKPNAVLAKIDTNGTLKWRTYLIPKQDPNKAFTTVVEDNKTNGYWVTLNFNDSLGKSFLYYMNKNGGLKLIGQLTLPDNSFIFNSFLPTMLSNGDILMSYRTKKSSVIHPVYGKNGVLYFERKQFEPYITKNTEIAISSENFIVYPNPTANSVYLLLPEVVGFDYFISDNTGKIIRKEKVVPTNLEHIDLANFSSGTYFLTIKTSNNQVFTKKIVKQ